MSVVNYNKLNMVFSMCDSNPQLTFLQSGFFPLQHNGLDTTSNQNWFHLKIHLKYVVADVCYDRRYYWEINATFEFMQSELSLGLDSIKLIAFSFAFILDSWSYILKNKVKLRSSWRYGTSSGFNYSHSKKWNIYLHLYFCILALVQSKVQRWILPLNMHCLQNSAKSEGHHNTRFPLKKSDNLEI